MSDLLDLFLALFAEEKEVVGKAATKPVKGEMEQHRNGLKRINELELCGVATGLLMAARLGHSQLAQEAPGPSVGAAAFGPGPWDLHRCAQLSTSSSCMSTFPRGQDVRQAFLGCGRVI